MGVKKKLSAKETSKYAQKRLKTSVFMRLLVKDALLRALYYTNTKNCEKHKKFTLQATKIRLSCFHDKSYPLLSSVDTFLFGHYSLRDAIFRDVSGHIQCGNDVLMEKSKKEEDSNPTQANNTKLAIF